MPVASDPSSFPQDHHQVLVIASKTAPTRARTAYPWPLTRFPCYASSLPVHAVTERPSAAHGPHLPRSLSVFSRVGTQKPSPEEPDPPPHLAGSGPRTHLYLLRRSATVADVSVTGPPDGLVVHTAPGEGPRRGPRRRPARHGSPPGTGTRNTPLPVA